MNSITDILQEINDSDVYDGVGYHLTLYSNGGGYISNSTGNIKIIEFNSLKSMYSKLNTLREYLNKQKGEEWTL